MVQGFPGGPVVETVLSIQGTQVQFPGWWTKILHASGHDLKRKIKKKKVKCKVKEQMLFGIKLHDGNDDIFSFILFFPTSRHSVEKL